MSAPVLTPAMARAFALVADAAPGAFHPPPGDAGRALGTALYDLERLGLAMHAGRGWKLTPRGEKHAADAQSFIGPGR